jgi:outer membrane protein
MRFLVAAAIAASIPAAHAGTLLDLYNLAVQNDLTLQQLAAGRDAAVEAGPRAWSAVLPQVAGTAYVRSNRRTGTSKDANDPGAAGTVLDESYGSSGVNVQLSQTIFDWSEFANVSAARKQVAQADAAFSSAQQALIVRLVTTYFAVLSAQDTLRADLDAQSGYKQQLEGLQESFKSGVAPVTDLKNAQAAYDAGAAAVLIDQTALSGAKRALAVMVGRPIGSIEPLRDEIVLAPPTPSDVESWARAASSDNPDVITAHFAAESAEKATSSAFGKHFPSLNAVGSYGNINTNSQFGNDVVNNYIGLQLQWNIFQGGAVMSAVRSAEAQQAQAVAIYQLALRTADQNVRNHFDGVVNGIATVNAASSAMASQQSSVLATEVGFKVGIRTIIDSLLARQTMTSVQKTFSSARYGYLTSLLALKSDVGQLTRKDLEDVDRMLAMASSSGRTLPPQR